MKRIIFTVLLISGVARAAESVFFQVNLVSGKVDGVTKVILQTLPNNQIKVYVDPNHCSSAGLCTEMAGIPQTVTPKVIKDSRPTDGPLLLGLTQSVSLEVSSGYNPEGKVSYTAILERKGESLRLPLKENIFVKTGSEE